MAPSRPPRPPPRVEKDSKEQLKKRGADFIRKISDKDRYAIFLEPVDTEQVPGYTDVISRPMDLSTAQKNLQMGVYRTPMELRADIDLIWSNCCVFNDDTSIYFKEAVRLRALSARYYDDLTRVLTRDGVAAELGLTSNRHSGPTRIPTKRPRQMRSNTHTESTIRKQDSTSRDKLDLVSSAADGSASASASASALAARQNSVSDIHIRRAQAAYDAAKITADNVFAEVKEASKAAGIPFSPQDHSREIFRGPQGLPGEPSLFSNQLQRDSCAQIPYHWRQLGRWHVRGRVHPKFLTKERARNVQFGRRYNNFIHKSGPVARRLLAIVLDPQIVQKHDQQRNFSIDNDSTGKASNDNAYFSLRQHYDTKPNGTLKPQLKNEGHDHEDSDKMDFDTLPLSSKALENSPERVNSSRNCREFDLPNGMGNSTPSNEDLLRDILGSDGYEKVMKPRKSPSPTSGSTSRNSIYRLRSLLRSNGVDPSFVTGLLHDSNDNNFSKDPLPNISDYKQTIDENGRPHEENLKRLLQANHSTMMNVLRLRALREQAHFSVQEDLEDREREYMDILAKGMTLAIRNVPPRFVAHPVDVAEAAQSLCRTVNIDNQDAKKH